MSVISYNIGAGVECFTAGADSELPFKVIQPHQTHSTSVAMVDRPDMDKQELEGVDALVTNLPGVAIGVRTADCIPVLLYDPVHKAVGAAHSGWRGTVNKIVTKTVLEMARQFKTKPEELKAVIGPGIGFDSFQVGEDVALIFKNSGFPVEKVWDFRGVRVEGSMEGGHHIDLKECVRNSLLECGVLYSCIELSPVDTYTDSRFYSARREGQQTGRNISAIKLL